MHGYVLGTKATFFGMKIWSTTNLIVFSSSVFKRRWRCHGAYYFMWRVYPSDIYPQFENLDGRTHTLPHTRSRGVALAGDGEGVSKVD
jgi:hypothetical protein